MRSKILIVDDEPEQIGAFAFSLQKEGYEVIIAEDDLETLYFLGELQLALIILDIRFGYDERMGLDILKKIRARDNVIPVIMLTGLSDERLDLMSYDRDADYFVRKSISTESLLALVRRCLRRGMPETIVIDDQIAIDTSRNLVRVKRSDNWQNVHLEPKEYDILLKLVNNAGRVITREQLYEQFFPYAQNPSETLNRYISELRKNLEPNPGSPRYILTRRSVGYWFKNYR